MIVPDFYDTFVCKAAACLHTCCRGWEIDIDDATAAHYIHLQGELGEKLRRAMGTSAEGYYFQLQGEDERCPFLQQNGLCELILTIGEENLCEICTLHPRFFEDIQVASGDIVTLAGVGLCCEAACSLLLAAHEPLQFVDDETGKAYTLAALLEQFGIFLSEEQLYFHPSYQKEDILYCIGLLSQTEPLNAKWTNRLTYLSTHIDEIVSVLQRQKGTEVHPIYHRMYQYILYRQLEWLDTVSMDVLCTYAAVNTLFVWIEAAMTADRGEALRRWSEQIEYDTDNVRFLIEQVCVSK